MGALAQSEHVVSRGLLQAPPIRPVAPMTAGPGKGGKAVRIGTCSPRSLFLSTPRRPVAWSKSNQSTRPAPGWSSWRASPGEPSAPPAPTLKALADKRRVAARPRGLRRLLPGAATLAVLASVWAGADPCGCTPPDADCSRVGCEGTRGLHIHCSARRHLVVHCLGPRAWRRPEATCGPARTAASRRPIGSGRRTETPLSKVRAGIRAGLCAARRSARSDAGSTRSRDGRASRWPIGATVNLVRCPWCGATEDRVVDSREVELGGGCPPSS